jgi:hypothetical protein
VVESLQQTLSVTDESHSIIEILAGISSFRGFSFAASESKVLVRRSFFFFTSAAAAGAGAGAKRQSNALSIMSSRAARVI